MPQPYEVIVTAVRDRADLLDTTLRSFLARADLSPARILVHEDVRPGRTGARHARQVANGVAADYRIPVEVFVREPGTGMGRAALALLEAARTDLVFYAQEDFEFVRPIPVARALQLMNDHQLHHVRFGKRGTERIKGESRPPEEWFEHREVVLDDQPLVISDNWGFQPSLWRRSIALAGFREIAARTQSGPIEWPEAKFNKWINDGIGGGVGCRTADIERRASTVKTFLWGRVGEPAFVAHIGGGERRTHGKNTST